MRERPLPEDVLRRPDFDEQMKRVEEMCDDEIERFLDRETQMDGGSDKAKNRAEEWWDARRSVYRFYRDFQTGKMDEAELERKYGILRGQMQEALGDEARTDEIIDETENMINGELNGRFRLRPRSTKPAGMYR